MNYIDKITMEDLKEEQKDLAELIGIENYIKMVKYFGGSSVYIHKADTIIKHLRDEHIVKEFTGENYKQLALKYNLTERTVREIISSRKYNINKFQTTLF